MVSAGTKALVADGPWARTGNRRTPEDAGIDRAEGWTEAYEQRGSGKLPEAAVTNQRRYEHEDAFIHVVARGVPAWSADLDYEPSADAHCFVTTSTGLWVSSVASGPTNGGAVNPDAPGQTTWRRY